MTVLLNRRQLLVTGAAVLAGGALARAHDGTVHVTIEKLAFQPADIEVKAGETIEWINKDPFAHTATVKAAGRCRYRPASRQPMSPPPTTTWTITAASTPT